MRWWPGHHGPSVPECLSADETQSVSEGLPIEVICRVVGVTVGSAKDLKGFVDLLGEHDELVRSVAVCGGPGMMAAHDVSMNTSRRLVLTENQIREFRSQKLGVCRLAGGVLVDRWGW